MKIIDTIAVAKADYYRLREAQERVRADLSQDPTVGRIHAELADRYAALIAADSAGALERAA